jgi:hypothetical protein
VRLGRQLQSLDQTGVDQHPVEPARLGAAIAEIELAAAALQDLFCSAKDASSGMPAASSTTNGR